MKMWVPAVQTLLKMNLGFDLKKKAATTVCVAFVNQFREGRRKGGWGRRGEDPLDLKDLNFKPVVLIVWRRNRDPFALLFKASLYDAILFQCEQWGE